MALSGSGVIFAIVACAWLCYLVPLTLRRHDDALRKRSVDRFSAAMRVLGRSDAKPVVPDVPRRGAPVAPRRVVAVPTRPTSPTAQASERRAARVAAARRRRVLVLLVAVAAAVTGLAAARLVPVWSPVAPVLLVAGFLALIRFQVNRARTAAWERALRTSAARSVVPAGARGDEPDEAPTEVFAAVPDVGAPARQQPPTPAVPDAGATEVTTAETGTADAGTGAVPTHAGTGTVTTYAGTGTVTTHAGTGTGTADVGTGPSTPLSMAGDGPGSLWDPLPVTLPTYVSKPRAERGIRTVDLAGPGSRSLDRQRTADGSPAVSSAGSEGAPRPLSAAEIAVARQAVGD